MDPMENEELKTDLIVQSRNKLNQCLKDMLDLCEMAGLECGYAASLLMTVLAAEYIGVSFRLGMTEEFLIEVTTAMIKDYPTENKEAKTSERS